MKDIDLIPEKKYRWLIEYHLEIFMQSTSSLQTVPLDTLHHSLNGKMVPFAGYNMPVQYSEGILQEHLHTRSAAGLFDVSHMGAIEITGEAVAAALETLVPTDIQEMQPGEVKYSFFLNEKGGIIDDLLISRLQNGFLLVVNADGKHADLQHLKSKIGSKVTLTPFFEKALFALQGPKAALVLERFFPSVSTLKFMSILETTYKGNRLFISRTGYTGEDGFELIIHAGHSKELFEALLEEPEVKPIGLGARDSLRLEAGLCLYGHDITQEITPIEAGLIWAIGKRRRLEGGFPGDKVIQKQIKSGVIQKRVGIAPQSKAIAREGTEIVTAARVVVGKVTSGTHSPCLSRPIAMGYVKTTALEDALFVNIRGQLYPLTLQKLPFVPHNYYRG